MLVENLREVDRMGLGKRLVSRLAWVAVAASVAPVLASCTSAPPAAGAGATAPSGGAVSRNSGGAASQNSGVISLTGISTLRSLFNRDNGHPRLVLIFSPT